MPGPMTLHRAASHTFNWRIELPVLSGRIVTLREPVADDCEAIVLDLSRNRSRRFCSTSCGNRVAVAAYRARQA